MNGEVVKYLNIDTNKEATSVAILGILDILGYELVKYEEEGTEEETSHGRTYYSPGKVEYKVEKKVLEALFMIEDELPNPATYSGDTYIYTHTVLFKYPYNFGKDEPICKRRTVTYHKVFEFNCWRWVSRNVEAY